MPNFSPKTNLDKLNYFTMYLARCINMLFRDEAFCLVLGNVQANKSISMLTTHRWPPASKYINFCKSCWQTVLNQWPGIFIENNSDNDSKMLVKRYITELDPPDDKVWTAMREGLKQAKTKKYVHCRRFTLINLN
jgi:hypothetical protein